MATFTLPTAVMSAGSSATGEIPFKILQAAGKFAVQKPDGGLLKPIDEELTEALRKLVLARASFRFSEYEGRRSGQTKRGPWVTLSKDDGTLYTAAELSSFAGKADGFWNLQGSGVEAHFTFNPDPTAAASFEEAALRAQQAYQARVERRENREASIGRQRQRLTLGQLI